MARVTAAVRCLPLTAAIGFLMFPYVLDGCPSKLTCAEITRSIYFLCTSTNKKQPNIIKNEKTILNYSRTGKRRAYDPFGALPSGDGFPAPAPILAGNFSKASFF